MFELEEESDDMFGSNDNSRKTTPYTEVIHKYYEEKIKNPYKKREILQLKKGCPDYLS